MTRPAPIAVQSFSRFVLVLVLWVRALRIRKNRCGRALSRLGDQTARQHSSRRWRWVIALALCVPVFLRVEPIA
jgi:hypothetical protein